MMYIIVRYSESRTIISIRFVEYLKKTKHSVPIPEKPKDKCFKQCEHV